MFQIPMAAVAAALSAAAGDPGAAPESESLWRLPVFEPAPLDHVGNRPDNGWYIQVGGALVTTQDSDGPDEEIDFDEGWGVPLAFGRRFGADDSNRIAFDLEAEGIYTDQDANQTGALEALSDLAVLGALLNAVGDFGLTDNVALYGGAGIGVAWVDVTEETTFEEEDGPFLAWQAKAGLRWYASRSVSWSLGYRFLNIDDAEIEDDLGASDFDLETQQHMIELGVRWAL